MGVECLTFMKFSLTSLTLPPPYTFLIFYKLSLLRGNHSVVSKKKGITEMTDTIYQSRRKGGNRVPLLNLIDF